MFLRSSEGDGCGERVREGFRSFGDFYWYCGISYEIEVFGERCVCIRGFLVKKESGRKKGV